MPILQNFFFFAAISSDVKKARAFVHEKFIQAGQMLAIRAGAYPSKALVVVLGYDKG
jgi:hypothetical protein